MNVNTPPTNSADTFSGNRSELKSKTSSGPSTVTIAEDSDSESKSVITTMGLTTTGEPVTPAATGVATTTGATTAPGTPSTVTTVAAGTAFGLPCSSTTLKDTVFTPAPPAVNVTDANNC